MRILRKKSEPQHSVVSRLKISAPLEIVILAKHIFAWRFFKSKFLFIWIDLIRLKTFSCLYNHVIQSCGSEEIIDLNRSTRSKSPKCGKIWKFSEISTLMIHLTFISSDSQLNNWTFFHDIASLLFLLFLHFELKIKSLTLSENNA